MTTEPFAAAKPRVGQTILYQGQPVGTVTRVEGNLCYRTYPDGEALPFIWRFKDGLNTMHDWPTKHVYLTACVVSECDEVADTLNYRPRDMSDAIRYVRSVMPDESATLIDNTAESLCWKAGFNPFQAR